MLVGGLRRRAVIGGGGGGGGSCWKAGGGSKTTKYLVTHAEETGGRGGVCGVGVGGAAEVRGEQLAQTERLCH